MAYKLTDDDFKKLQDSVITLVTIIGNCINERYDEKAKIIERGKQAIQEFSKGKNGGN